MVSYILTNKLELSNYIECADLTDRQEAKTSDGRKIRQAK